MVRSNIRFKEDYEGLYEPFVILEKRVSELLYKDNCEWDSYDNRQQLVFIY